MSGATAAKQAERHPNIEAADYALVQRIVDEGEIFQASPRLVVGFLEVDGRLWRAVIKATGDGTETYLQTLHLARDRDRAAAARRHSKIER